MAEWKLCSDKGLSALPAAISERCHRYGDGRLFSLIIGNCECVSVPVHGYSNIKDTCQRKPVLWIWWAQQLLWKCTGLCLMCTHRHLTDEGSRQRSWCGHQTVHERALKEKSFDRKFVSLSPLDKTKAYVRSVELRRSERDKMKKKKSVILFTEGCLGPACDVITLMVSHLEEVLGDVQQGGEAWSRLIALSWMTCSC